MGFSANYEFVGLLKFDKSQIISYRLVFEESGGRIAGYSITDMHGIHETRNRIAGTYDRKTGTFYFEEKEIEYTKSSYSKTEFCYLRFRGKVNLESATAIKGAFRGLFRDGTSCVDGTLQLVIEQKAEQRIAKVQKRVQKVQAKASKEKIDLPALVRTLKSTTVRKNEKSSFFFNSNEVTLEIFDGGREDGDKVSLFIDDVPFIEQLVARTDKKTYTIRLLKSLTTLRIVADNEGEVAPNTTRFRFSSPERLIEINADLQKSDETMIRLVRNVEN